MNAALHGLTDYRAPFDLQLFELLNHLGSRAVDALAVGLSSHLFAGLGIAAAVLALLFARRPLSLLAPVLALLAVGATDLLGHRLLKPLLHRRRPCFALDPSQAHQLFAVADGGSLPSLHAANAFALAVVVARVFPRAAGPTYLVATLVALSRVVGGVHWPSDVLAGALYGTAIGLLATLPLRCPRSHKQAGQGGGQGPSEHTNVSGPA